MISVNASRPEEGIFRFLDTNGDGSGVSNAIGDYSLAATEFFYQAPRPINIFRVTIYMETTPGISAEVYGNTGGKLVNGYKLLVLSGTGEQLQDYTAGLPIKTNGSFGRVCNTVDLYTWGSGNEFIQANFLFWSSGAPIELDRDDRLSVMLNDDFSSIAEHYFLVHGQERN